MPFRVHFVADLDPQSSQLDTRTYKVQLQRHRRRAERYQLTYEVTTDPRDYHRFFDRMYLPTMMSRHGERARWVQREAGFHQLFSKGNLLMVRSAGELGAGIVSVIDETTGHIDVRLVGWLGAEDRFLQMEILKSAYFFLREWATDKGYASLDFMGCEPFLSKGTFQSKRRLGVEAIHAPDDLADLRLYLHIGSDLPPIRDFLCANPIVARDEQDRLGATYFFDGTRPLREELAHACHGMEFAREIHMDEIFRGWESS